MPGARFRTKGFLRSNGGRVGGIVVIGSPWRSMPELWRLRRAGGFGRRKPGLMRIAWVTQNVRDACWLRGQGEINEMGIGQQDNYASDHRSSDGDSRASEPGGAVLETRFQALALLLNHLRPSTEIENIKQ